MKRRVGAILVRDNRILATGCISYLTYSRLDLTRRRYNGTPRGVKNCNEGGCKHCNSSSSSQDIPHECVCLHAEENALLEAGRERIGSNSVLYCNTFVMISDKPACSNFPEQMSMPKVHYQNHSNRRYNSDLQPGLQSVGRDYLITDIHITYLQ